MTRDQALAKIKKCLALAKSSNQHEAAAAMRQAQKLMAEHRVTELDVGLADVSEHAAPAQLRSHTPWEGLLSNLVAEAFGCALYSSSRKYLTPSRKVAKKREYMFVGVGAAPQVASYAYGVLSRQCANDRLAHIRRQPKNCKPITKTARGDEFAFGWVVGVKDLIDRFSGSDQDKQLVEQYMATNYSDLSGIEVKDRSVGRNVRYSDVAQGKAAGRKARLNRGVGSPVQQELLL